MEDIENKDTQRSMLRLAAGYFLLILFGSLFSSLIGGVFGALVAIISPDFVKGLFTDRSSEQSIVRYAFSVGMIWGLFIGVAVSGVACGLTTLLKIIKLKIEHKKTI